MDFRTHFPVFSTPRSLVYLDNASTTQTPEVVLQAMHSYYTEYRSNVHRGMYPLAQEATERYEQARKIIAEYLGAQAEEIVFTYGTTLGINMLQKSLTSFFEPGDNIVLSRLEHHANLIPWQMAAKKYGMELRFIGELIPGTVGGFDFLQQELERCIDKKTKVVSVAHVSNALGTILPLKQIIARAKEVGAMTIVDGAQAIGHMPVNVRELGCDFYVFSGHKMYGPTGIGCIYGKKELLQKMKPVIYGGEMIETVTYENATWAQSPHRFEAGTPNIAGAIGLATAFVFLNHVRWEDVQEHETDLVEYALARIGEHADIVGNKTKENRIGVISFNVPGVHPHDVADILGKSNICVRAGHHCAMPLMGYMGTSGTVRMSLGMYNTKEEIDCLVSGIQEVQTLFRV